MCFIVSNSSKVLLMLEGDLIAFKEFYVEINDNGIKLMPSYIYGFEYNFEKEGNFLVARENNQQQEVNFVINSKLPSGEIGEVIVSKKYDLGFHISMFDRLDNFEDCFKTFEIGNFEEEQIVWLPVVVENIQMIGLQSLVVERFKILDYQKYISLCNAYNMQPDEEVIEFLKDLFESYS
jgi:hypothetical protein